MTGHLYLLKRQSDGAVKIGFAENVTADPDYMLGCKANSGVSILVAYAAEAGSERGVQDRLAPHLEADGWLTNVPDVAAIANAIHATVSEMMRGTKQRVDG